MMKIPTDLERGKRGTRVTPLNFQMNIKYEECLAFIEKVRRIRLYPFQKEMLWAFCQNEPIRTSRCSGRTMIAHGLGEYIASKLDRQDTACANSVLSIPYTTVVEQSKLLDEKIIAGMQNRMSCEAFASEFSLEDI